MKKLLAFLMCISLLAGCSSQTDDSTDLDNKTPENNTTDNITDNTDDTVDWYGRFEGRLKSGNITYSNRSSLDATTIGAAEGYRYTTQNGNIDIYRFEDGEEFDKIKNDKKMTIDGKEYNVSIKDKMVIVTDELKDDIKDIFDGMD